ncbi:MAG: poly-gamma-glutamate synthase PgsB, partial [Bacteroidales bacterium]|nr:poly-gamma-glutamate synthase PgsB [Bacteroidales bacterium]
MYSFFLLLAIIILSSIAGVIEYRRHQRRIFSIPVRVHINGTRGKSSVTRLVGAGLRAAGTSTLTKVTGTIPRLILDDGT